VTVSAAPPVCTPAGAVLEDVIAHVEHSPACSDEIQFADLTETTEDATVAVSCSAGKFLLACIPMNHTPATGNPYEDARIRFERAQANSRQAQATAAAILRAAEDEWLAANRHLGSFEVSDGIPLPQYR
jgi:hypothetical protein